MTNEFLKLEGNQIYIDASHRRTQLDKWVFVCIGDEQDLQTLRKVVLSGQDLGQVAAVASAECRADFENWQNVVRMEQQQLKARFFGMHLGCRLSVDGLEDPIITGVTNYSYSGVSVLATDRKIKSTTFHSLGLDICKLILRPLSSITDQEAIECAKLVGYKDVSPTHAEYVKKCIIYGGMKLHVETNLHWLLADHLRSRNFCLPFQNVDPVEAGWAVLETENQNQK